MSFSPVDNFVFATWLNDTKPDTPSESLIRTVINRAYNAALISARGFTGVDTRGRDGHKRVVDELLSRDSFAGNKLNILRLRRHKADYDIAEIFTKREALFSLQDARAVLYAAGCAPSSPPYSINYLDTTKFLALPDEE